jgi:protoheme IX farnesyltransferase
VKLSGLGPLLLGLALVGMGCGALNQYLEADIDARMWRTMNRPLPAGRMTGKQALIFGFATALLGELILLFATNAITAVLAALTFFFYLAVYTPSKRLTSMSTLIGAVPGALPPLMGWTASHGRVAPEGLLLFAILLLWQIPHFLAIGWIYREDYARAELPILSVIDEEGIATAKQVILYSIVLLPLTLVPSLWGVTGRVYFLGAMALGIALLAFGILWAIHRSKLTARRLFLASIFYLPGLGLLMVWDRNF